MASFSDIASGIGRMAQRVKKSAQSGYDVGPQDRPQKGSVPQKRPAPAGASHVSGTEQSKGGTGRRQLVPEEIMKSVRGGRK